MCSKPRSPPKRVTFDLPPESFARESASFSVPQNDKQISFENLNTPRYTMEKPVTSKKNTTVKKVFVRHSETELPTNKMVAKIPGEMHLTEIVESNPDIARAYRARYAVPELFSALCIAKEFQDKKTEHKNIKSVPVPVSIKQIVDGKAASKLNFSPEEQLFKDLVNLNVNDEMLVGATEERTVSWKLSKDEEPKLSDFYQPKWVGEYTSVSQPSLSAIGKIRNYNGFSTYKRKIAWTLAEGP